MIRVCLVILCWCIVGQGHGQFIDREVDKYERKGYFVLPGQASLREQIAAVFKWQALQCRQDSLYYSVTAIARATTYHAAKMQAECRSREGSQSQVPPQQLPEEAAPADVFSSLLLL